MHGALAAHEPFDTYGGKATLLGANVFEEEHPLQGKVGEKKRGGDGCE